MRIDRKSINMWKGGIECVYCKNVGYDIVSTLVRTLGRDLVLELLEDEL